MVVEGRFFVGVFVHEEVSLQIFLNLFYSLSLKSQVTVPLCFCLTANRMLTRNVCVEEEELVMFAQVLPSNKNLLRWFSRWLRWRGLLENKQIMLVEQLQVVTPPYKDKYTSCRRVIELFKSIRAQQPLKCQIYVWNTASFFWIKTQHPG